jgi:molybdopterin-containing oxidoreductase family membrane subunit
MRHLSAGWKAFFIAVVVILGLGAFAWILEVSRGMIATGLRNLGTMGGATWGLYVTFVVYFVGVSFAGITVAALIRLFNIEGLQPVTRIAEVLTVVALILGAITIVADLGQPVRGIINLFRYARPQSPFFGTFTTVIAGYLFASLVYLYLGSRRDAAVMASRAGPLQGLHRFVAAGYRDTPAQRERHRRASFWLALAVIPMLVIAHSTLGFVFGLQVGRPGWFSALQAPAFVVLAGVSGIGLLIVLVAIVRRVGNEHHTLTMKTFRWLGLFLLVLIAVYLYFMITELLSATYTGTRAETAVSEAILSGEYAWIFWTSVALLVLPLIALVWMAIVRRWSIGLLVAAGIAVNLAAVGKRYLIVVPSQTHGQLLPYEVGSYTPSLIELTVILGLLALGALLIGLYMRFMPIVPLDPEEVV